MSNEINQIAENVITANDDAAARAMIYTLMKREDEKQNSLEWQMDLTKTTREILMRAGGYTYDKTSNKVLRYGKATFNPTGVLRLGELLDTYLNKDTISSNLSYTEIGKIMRPIVYHIPREFYINREQYGIDMVRFPTSMNMIYHPIYMALKRAFEDGTRRWQSTMMKYVENILNKANLGENKRGILKE